MDNFVTPVQDRSPNASWADIFISPADARRFAEVLALLSKHFVEPMIVTGSFAAEWQMQEKGGEVRKRRLNDIDLVAAKGLAGIGAGLKTDFLIHHFHPTREAGNVFVQLVEPRSCTRVDIFSPRSPLLSARTSKVNIDGTNCELLSAEDLTARLLAIVGIVLDGTSVDPKYLDALKRLMVVTDPGLTAELWNDYRRSSDPADLNDAFHAVTHMLGERSDLLRPVEYSQDINAECPWCIVSDDFPLAPRTQIYEMLGYV